MTPLLDDPIQSWVGYAITQILRPKDDRLAEPVMGRNIRTKRWRFTEWAEGKAGLELYHHHTDPMEFLNLAVDPEPSARTTIEKLRTLLRTRTSGKVPTSPFNFSRL